MFSQERKVMTPYLLTLSGKKSDDPLSPDFVPSVFAHVSSPVKRAVSKKMDSFHKRAVA